MRRVRMLDLTFLPLEANKQRRGALNTMAVRLAVHGEEFMQSERKSPDRKLRETTGNEKEIKVDIPKIDGR